MFKPGTASIHSGNLVKQLQSEKYPCMSGILRSSSPAQRAWRPPRWRLVILWPCDWIVGCRMSLVRMARSTSRKEATEKKMRFTGQATGDGNLLDQTVTSYSKYNIPSRISSIIIYYNLFLNTPTKGNEIILFKFNYSHVCTSSPKTSIAEASSLAVEVSISIGMPCKRNLAGTMWKKCRHGNLQHQFMPSHPKQPMGNLPMPKNCS